MEGGGGRTLSYCLLNLSTRQWCGWLSTRDEWTDVQCAKSRTGGANYYGGGREMEKGSKGKVGEDNVTEIGHRSGGRGRRWCTIAWRARSCQYCIHVCSFILSEGCPSKCLVRSSLVAISFICMRVYACLVACRWSWLPFHSPHPHPAG